MNRRNFLRGLVGGVAATAAVRAFPFRVYSFSAEVVVPTLDQIAAITLAELRDEILYDNFFVDTPWLTKSRWS